MGAQAPTCYGVAPSMNNVTMIQIKITTIHDTVFFFRFLFIKKNTNINSLHRLEENLCQNLSLPKAIQSRKKEKGSEAANL